jgi:hypothetical protein
MAAEHRIEFFDGNDQQSDLALQMNIYKLMVFDLVRCFAVQMDSLLPTFKTASVVKWLAYWPLEPEFAGSNPAEAVGFFGHPKNPQYAFLRRGM